MNHDRVKTRINVHSFDLFLIGVVLFVAILVLTVLAYEVFIRERVKHSEEYQTAVFFAVHSPSVQDRLLAPIERLDFDDLWIKEEADYGVCFVTFDLHLQNGLQDRLKVGLVKVSDFWIVYEADLGWKTPSEVSLVSTYQKVIVLLERLEYQDAQTAQTYLQVLQQEIQNAALLDYLTARVSALSGDTQQAMQLLNDLESRVQASLWAVLFEKGLIAFSERDYTAAAAEFEKIVVAAAIEKENRAVVDSPDFFLTNQPKDPLVATLNHDTIYAEALQNLALTYYQLGEHQKSLDTVELALEAAQTAHSQRSWSASLFVKALTLFALQQFEQADQCFARVITDEDNQNLAQKAWAYYYRALVAHALEQWDDSLDYFETAVNLDPFNALIRKGAVDYLLTRNRTGDRQIALGMALRGVQYKVDPEAFRKLSAELANKLGVRDVSGEL